VQMKKRKHCWNSRVFQFAQDSGFPLSHQKWANNTQDDLVSRHTFEVLVALEYKLLMQTLKLNNLNTKKGSKWVVLCCKLCNINLEARL
jgi:hypothetical protein